MTNLAATDLTITEITKSLQGGTPYVCRVLKLVFGDGALTYPSGGVPITKSKLGCPNDIQSLKIFDSGTGGIRWHYDKTNEKLIAMVSDAHTHDIFFKNAVAAPYNINTAVSIGVSNVMGSNGANNFSVTGVVNTAGNSGVVNKSAAVMAEPSAVAIASQTLFIEVIGW